MSKTKTFKFNAEERKYHILTAFRLYQVEMYIAQKAMGVIKEEHKGGIFEKKMEDFFTDYETQQSLSVLFETVAVFEPELYENIKALEIYEAISKVLSYLTGEEINVETIGVTKAPMAESSAKDAIDIKDLKDPNKIVTARTMPQGNPLEVMNKKTR